MSDASLLSLRARLPTSTSDAPIQQNRSLGVLPSSGLDDGYDQLQPHVPLRDHLKKTLTPSRIGIVAFFILLSIVGVALVPENNFRYTVEVRDIRSLSDCVLYCRKAESKNVTNPSWPDGAVGLCQEPASGKSTIVYKECYGHGHTDCHSANHSYHPDPKDKIERTFCQFPLVPVRWMPYATVSIFAVAITLVIQGFAPEVLLLGAACVLSVLGVVTSDDVIAGFANGGVMSLAVLFPISEAITETGMLETVVGLMLGEPKTLCSALIRMIFPVALVSAFLSNTATVAMMIPIITSWSRRLDVHPGRMLMPLSFAAQLGGCLTLLGGSQCLVAKAAVPESIYSMGFFDLFPIGFCNLVGAALIITVLSPTRLLNSSEASATTLTPPANDSELQTHVPVYRIIVIVKDRSPKFGGLCGKSLRDSGLNRLDGVAKVSYRGSSASSLGDDPVRVLAEASDADVALISNDKLEVECDETGVISLRQHPGILFGNQADLDKLGAYRRQRKLYEVSVASNSELLKQAYTFQPGKMGIDYDEDGFVKNVIKGAPADVMGIKPGSKIVKFEMDGAIEQTYSQVALTDAEAGTSGYTVTFLVSVGVLQDALFFRNYLGACLVAVKSCQDKEFILEAGSVLLLEADQRIVGQRAMRWGASFSVIRCVPNSSPPRGTLSVDVFRNILTCGGMIILIALVTINAVELHIGGVIFLLALLFIRALTVSQLLESMKPKILLTIVGALALGTALEKSGVVNYIAGLITVAHGPIAITALIYVISVVLSMFINNSATIAILAPMLIELSESGDAGLRIEPMVWALVYGAGSCFTTPLGYQTNLMVMPDGQYSFADFMRFGSVVQLCHLVFTVVFTYTLSPLALAFAGFDGQ